MLRIVDLHLSTHVDGEYVVLQNQGLQTINLRGWMLVDEALFSGNPAAAAQNMYIFTDDVVLKPYTRVVLFTGTGFTGWQPTNDGRHAWVAYWNRPGRVWTFAKQLVVMQPAATRRVGITNEDAVLLTA
jgi:hypothetical protein